LLPPAFRFLKIALVLPPDLLRARLAARVEEQFRRGFPEEVRRLVSQYGEHAPGLQAVGYRQMLPYLRGDVNLEEAKRAVLRAHWQYARRQLTWLRTEPELVRMTSAAEAHRTVSEFLHKKKLPPTS
jgi:tRNA dimethylallyltransferase